MIARRIPEIVVLLAILAPVACSKKAPPDQGAVVIGSREGDAGRTGEVGAVQAGVEGDGRSTAARFNIAPGHLPPPGQCRVWMPGEPPGQQKKKYPVGRCSELRLSIPPGAWLVYRPTDDKKEVRVWEYGAERQVLSQRIYSAITGELIRHVAPVGN